MIWFHECLSVIFVKQASLVEVSRPLDGCLMLRSTGCVRISVKAGYWGVLISNVALQKYR